MISTSIKPDNGLSRATSPQGILQSVLAGLNEGRISKVVEQFDELFTFDDHALGLEFSDKERLTEFFQKSRELFPEAAVEVDSTLECGDHAIAEWKLTATESVPFWPSAASKSNFLARCIDRAN